MKKLTTIVLATLMALVSASSSSARQSWVAQREGDTYMLGTTAVANNHASIGRLSIGLVCAGENELHITMIGDHMKGVGEIEYVFYVDDGPVVKPFIPVGPLNSVLFGDRETHPIIESFKRGNTLFVGAQDERKNLSVFEFSLAGFTRAFNGHIPAHCRE